MFDFRASSPTVVLEDPATTDVQIEAASDKLGEDSGHCGGSQANSAQLIQMRPPSRGAASSSVGGSSKRTSQVSSCTAVLSADGSNQESMMLKTDMFVVNLEL